MDCKSSSLRPPQQGRRAGTLHLPASSHTGAGSNDRGVAPLTEKSLAPVATASTCSEGNSPDVLPSFPRWLA